MSYDPLPPPPANRTARAAVLYPLFFGVLAVWTYLLVSPNPIPEVKDEIPVDLHFIAAKCLHASAYAGLAVLMMLLPVPASAAHIIRPALIGLLLLHGVGTEIAQTYVPGRNGCVRDALIDWAGAVVGIAATWPLWRPR